MGSSATSASGIADLSVEAQGFLRSAMAAHRAGDLGRALELYEAVLERHPNQVSVLFLAGKLLLDTDDTERGLAWMHRAVDLNPDDPNSRVLLGHGHFFQLEYDQALEHYERVLRQDPKQAKIHYYIGRSLARMGRHEAAQLHLACAFEEDPTDAFVLYELGLCRLLGDETTRSEGADLVRRAMAMQPDLLGIEVADLRPLQRHRQEQNDRMPIFRTADEPVRRRPEGPYACFSYPKCGTHLLSDTAQLITGDKFYWPNDFESNAVPPDALNRVPEGHFFIGHWHVNPGFGMDMRTKGCKAIVQYRDPRDQMVSFYYYYTGVAQDPENMYSQILAGVSREEAINRLIVGGYLKGRRIIPGQGINMIAWMDVWYRACSFFKIPVFFVSYEEMVENKVETVGRLARFLGMPLSRAECEVIAEATGFEKRSATMEKNEAPKGFKRKGVAGDWKNHFSPANKALFKAVSGGMLQQLGYEVDDAW